MDRFPLLVKLLDAQDDLSVQVHPSEEDCRARFSEHHGKDESWIVLHSEPGGRVLHSFNPGVTLEDFKRRVAEGSVGGCLRVVEVKPGDALRVAPGTVHALCRGVVLLEIQQPSDSTFRIYDYGRLGDDGKPRPLHLDLAESVLRFDVGPALLAPRSHSFPWGRHEIVVDCPAYRIERFEIGAPSSPSSPSGPPSPSLPPNPPNPASPTTRTNRTLFWTVNPRSVQALVVIEGEGRLVAGGVTIEIKTGQSVILPAAIGRVTLSCAAFARFVLAGAGGAPLLSSAVL